MIDDHGNCMFETPLPQDAELPCGLRSTSSTWDDVGEIDIAFERRPSHPRLATFD